MITKVQNFISPQHSGFFIGQHALQNIAQTLDKNHNGVLSPRDELQISPQFKQKVDFNRNGRVETFELIQLLSQDQIALKGFSAQASQQIAGQIIGTQVYTEALGKLGKSLDGNRDGFVTQFELSSALNRGEVLVSGNYLVKAKGGSGLPSDPSSPEGAKEYIQTLKDQIMKKLPSGGYDPNSGIYTPREGNRKINNFINTVVMSSEQMMVQDKLEILFGQLMQKNSYGSYDESSGSLRPRDAQDLAETVIENPQIADEFSAQSYVQGIRQHVMQKNSYGSYDESSGLFKPRDANDALENFFENTLIPHRNVSVATKIRLIRSEVMQKNANGSYDESSGSLRPRDAKDLIDKLDY